MAYLVQTLGIFIIASTQAFASNVVNLDCIDDVACSSWVSTQDTSNCSKFSSLLHLNCPLACGVCDSHAVFRRCLSEDAFKGNGSALVSAASSMATLASGIQTKSESWATTSLTVLEKPLPLLLQADNFLSVAEATELIALAEQTGFQKSSRYIDGAAELRTSVTTFCRGSCAWTALVASFVDRISNALGIPFGHFEPVQFVRYNNGEYYTEHSDFIPEDIETMSGPRLLTFFVYLSDKFGGGETDFPKLNKRVSPKVGRIATWTNTMTYIGGKSGKIRWLPDGKTNHKALPVEVDDELSGPKYAANVWIHNHDVRHVELYQERCQAAIAQKMGNSDDPLEL